MFCARPAWRGGLIPAHAGKTDRSRHAHHCSRAHPRSRGENWPVSTPGMIVAGSSPLTRGKRSHGGQDEATRRLIPAHAGKTSAVARELPRGGAHPRSRGENNPTCQASSYPPGSSPLTRGKHLPRVQNTPRGGLIPAHAGKTAPGTRPNCRGGAHPRSRGENTAGVPHVATARGSSPLTRGKRRSSVLDE